MVFFSIKGIQIGVEEILARDGYRQMEPRHYRIRNCEWEAELVVTESYDSPYGKTVYATPYYSEGNLDKLRRDIENIRSVIELSVCEPGSSLSLGHLANA